jgi:Nitroreductase family
VILRARRVSPRWRENQAFIEQAPLFLVWVADLGRARRLAARAGTPLEAVDYLETTIIGFIDTALAAQNVVVAVESLGLGSVFVGAIRNRPDEVAAELGLPRHTIVAFGLAVGSPDPDENAGVKPRPPQAAVLHHEQYDAAGRMPISRSTTGGCRRTTPATACGAAGSIGCLHASQVRSRWLVATRFARHSRAGVSRRPSCSRHVVPPWA